MCIWIWGAAEGGRLSALGIPEEYHSMPAPMLTIGMLMDPDALKETFSLLHLWFLHQLIVIYAGFLFLRAVANKMLRSKVYSKLAQRLDSALRTTAGSGIKWLVFPVLTIPVLLAMNGWGVDTPNNSLVPHLPTTLLYGIFFIVGWLLHRQSDLLAGLGSARRWGTALLVGFALSWVTKFYGNINDYIDPANTYGGYDRVIYAMLYAVMMWSLVFGFMGLFVRFTSSRNDTWRYVADSSYWIYLVHHIVIVPVQILFANIYWPAGIKYVLINAICLPILFLSYHYFVRFTWLGKWLNGKKHERATVPNTAAVTPQIAD
jgi:hypothetical protein